MRFFGNKQTFVSSLQDKIVKGWVRGWMCRSAEKIDSKFELSFKQDYPCGSQTS